MDAFIDVSYTEFKPETYDGMTIQIGLNTEPVFYQRDPNLPLQQAFELNYAEICDAIPQSIERAFFMSSFDHFISDASIDTAFLNENEPAQVVGQVDSIDVEPDNTTFFDKHDESGS